MKKTIAMLCIIVMLTCMLASCGASLNDLIGTWHSDYTYNGSKYSVTFYIDEDGSYGEVTFKNGVLHSTESGDVEIEGSTVYLHPTGSKSRTVFTYKDGTLLNGDHVYTKSE